MTREQHLEFCKVCLNRTFDPKQGLICNLTNKIADFENNCENFNEDEKEKRKIEIKPDYVKQENIEKLNNGSQWFLWIFGLSIVNTLILFFGGQVSFIFGLGITQIFEGFYIGLFGKLNIIGVFISIFVSSIFLIIWYYSKGLSKVAFIIGMIIYGIDAIILLFFQEYLCFGVHIYALFMILKGYQSINKIEK
jgi:hypothetical protein